jgi:hypothetical protein
VLLSTEKQNKSFESWVLIPAFVAFISSGIATIVIMNRKNSITIKDISSVEIFCISLCAVSLSICLLVLVARSFKRDYLREVIIHQDDEIYELRDYTGKVTREYIRVSLNNLSIRIEILGEKQMLDATALPKIRKFNENVESLFKLDPQKIVQFLDDFNKQCVDVNSKEPTNTKLEQTEKPQQIGQSTKK